MSKSLQTQPANLIRNGMKIFIHCYSKTVINLLIEGYKQGKKFEVYNTEIRPKLLGRRAAKTLAQKGIKVTHMPDLAGPISLPECDLLLMGAEKITANGKIYNKIGSNTLLEIAKKHKIPAYICTKPNKPPKNRNQKAEHVWKNPPKNIKIFNPGFEEINEKNLTGIIAV